MSFQPAHGICSGLPENRPRPCWAISRASAAAWGRHCRRRLKIALQRQYRDGRGRDQQQGVAGFGSPRGHQTGVRRACRTTCRPAAQPNSVAAASISPAWTSRLFRAGRTAADGRKCCPDKGEAGARRIAVAVSLAASIRSGLTDFVLRAPALKGFPLIATRRRLVSEGKCRDGRRSRLAARPAHRPATTNSNRPTAPNAQNSPYLISIQRNSASMPTRTAAIRKMPQAVNRPAAMA